MPELHNSTSTRRRSLTFRELISVLTDKLGHDHFPYDLTQGTTINDIVHGNIIHHDLVKELIIMLYKANQCASFGCTVYADKVFDVLGKTEAKLRQRGDADSLRFINDIGWLCRELYEHKRLAYSTVFDSVHAEGKSKVGHQPEVRFLTGLDR